MGFLDIFKRNKNAKYRPYELLDFMATNTTGGTTDAVSFAALDHIAAQFAKLNYGVYSKETRQKIKNNWIYELIQQPNLEEDHFLFFYNSIIDYYNKGVFYKIARNTSGRPVSLFRLNPDNVTVTRNPETNARQYNYNGLVYTDYDLLYIPSRFNYNTKSGGSSIYSAVPNLFNTSLKLEQYTAASFSNGINGNRLVMDVSEAYPDLTKEQAEELKNLLQRNYAGVENANKPLLQWKGIKYTEIGKGTDNRSADLTANRELQKKDVAMVYSLPLDIISGASKDIDIEKSFLLMNTFAIEPLALQFAQAFNKLLADSSLYFEYDYNGLLKTSLTQRIDAYIKQINNGLLSPNEARAKENLEPIEAGHNYFVPANNMPLNDETIAAYMAKQKAAVNADTETTQGVLNSQHNPAGDDKD